MKIEYLASANAHNLNSGYAQCVSLREFRQLAFVSGQIPVRADGTVPATFTEQAELVWSNIEAQLAAAGMGVGNIVKHTTYLSDRRYRDAYRAVRRRALCGHEPALTLIIAEIFDDAWLLEVEVIAAA